MRSTSMSRPSDAFVDDLRGRLVGALVLSLNDRAVAEEVAQEALAKAVVHRSRVSQMDGPQGWVFKVAFNISRSRFRRLAAERRAYARVGETARQTQGPEDVVPQALALDKPWKHCRPVSARLWQHGFMPTCRWPIPPG